MTDPSNEDVFSGVVSMSTVRIVFVLARINKHNSVMCICTHLHNHMCSLLGYMHV